MNRALFAVLFLVAPMAAGSLAHSQDRQAAPQPTFRSGVELVRIDVRFLDDTGRLVTDLKAEELEVVDGGQVRPVVLFQRVAEPSGTYLEIARRTSGADVSTNRGAPRAHLYVIVFDQNHITPGNEQRARLAAERFLKTRVRPGDRVALYALPGPGPQISFTADMRGMLSQLIAVRGSLDKETFGALGGMTLYEAFEITRGNDLILQRVATRANGTDASSDLVAAIQRAAGSAASDSTPYGVLQSVLKDNARSVVERADGETRAFLSSLADVIRGLAGIDGRKSLILISEGFYADFVGGEVERVAAAAAQSYTVIYSLDINRRGADPSQAAPTGNDAQMEVQDRIEPLGSLAAETSGELVTDASSRMDLTFNRIAEQSLDYFIVGFEPGGNIAPNELDRYHRVSIRSKRPGITVRARTGYSVRDPVFVKDRRRAIDTALAAPFPQQGLPVEVTTYVTRGHSPGTHRVLMSVQAELPVDVGPVPRRADVVFVAKSAKDGRVVASGTDVMSLPAGTTRGSTGPAQYNVQFDAPSGEYLMRVVVREPSGGVTGSVDRRFEVRYFDGTDVSVSDLIVNRKSGTLAVRAQAYADDVLTAMLEVYGRDAKELDKVEVQATLLTAAGEPLRHVRADLRESTQAKDTVATRVARIELPLDGAPAGDYVLRATVRAKGETVTELDREVVVLSGPPPPAAAATAAAPAAFEPTDILNGDIAQRLVASLRDRATDPGIRKAAELAATRAWDSVAAALPASAGASMPGRVLGGMASFARRQYADAVTSFQAALELGPTSGVTAFLLGWAHSASGNESAAITAWRAAAVATPTLVSAYLALADAYLRESQPALAIQVLRAGLTAVPKSVELQNKLTEVERLR